MFRDDADEDVAIAAALRGAPEWITPELMRKTLNVGALFSVLLTPDVAAHPSTLKAAKSTVRTTTSDS